MNMEKKGSQGDGSVGPGRGVAQRSLKTRGLCAAEGDDCCPCGADGTVPLTPTALPDLDALVQDALYQELTDLGDGKSIVRDIPTGKLYFRKRLSVYNMEVFSYLKDHRNRRIPAIIQYYEDGGELVVIEELIQGRNLEEVLTEAEQKGEALPFAEKIRILTAVCEGLDFLHHATPPIIHRDLKPSNIMLTEGGDVKIIDYDAAKVFIPGKKKDTVLIGTHGVAAPEQYGFAQSDVRTDIFGLGKLVELLLPDNREAMHVAEKATRMKPEERYGSVLEMKTAISRIHEHLTGYAGFLARIPGYDERKWLHRALSYVIPILLISALLGSVAAAAQHFVIAPIREAARQKAEAEALAAAMPEHFANLTDSSVRWIAFAGAVRSFGEKYPYEQLSEEQRAALTDKATEMLKDSQKYDAESLAKTGTQIVEALTAYTGEAEKWQALQEYARATMLVENGKAVSAIEAVEALAESDIPEGEAWDEEIKAAALAEAREVETKLDGAVRTDTCKKVLDAYDELRGYIPEAETDFERCYAVVLAKADAFRDKEDFKNSALFYDLLAGYKSSSGVDIEERKNENLYQKAAVWSREGKYQAASEAFQSLAGYKDSETRSLSCRMQYCQTHADDPDDETYTYLSELLAAGYEGADELKEKIYAWHVQIETGVNHSIGSMQGADIRVTPLGGPEGGTIGLHLYVRDMITGAENRYTDGEQHARGEPMLATYSKNDASFNLFEREFYVEVSDDNGTVLATWQGCYVDEFLPRTTTEDG